jgi:hypothetical protein
LRSGASYHAGYTDGNLAEGCRRHAAERDHADADLAPQIQIAARVRSLGLELFDRSERIATDRAEFDPVCGLDYFG